MTRVSTLEDQISNGLTVKHGSTVTTTVTDYYNTNDISVPVPSMSFPIILLITMTYTNSFTITYKSASSSKTIRIYIGMKQGNKSQTLYYNDSAVDVAPNNIHIAYSSTTAKTESIVANTISQGIFYRNEYDRFYPNFVDAYIDTSTLMDFYGYSITNNQISINTSCVSATSTGTATFSANPVLSYKATIIGID